MSEMPSVYRVPASKASLAQNRFRFQVTEGGKVYDVPKLKFIRPALALRLESASEIEAATLVIKEYMPDAFEEIEDAEQLQDFMDNWAKASGVSLGE